MDLTKIKNIGIDAQPALNQIVAIGMVNAMYALMALRESQGKPIDSGEAGVIVFEDFVSFMKILESAPRK